MSTKSIRNISDDEDDSEKIRYMTREEQYELRKKLFYKGEYMILNSALLLYIFMAIFGIIFVSTWHELGGSDMGMYVMVGVAFALVITVLIMVKIRLRLARHAPGGYKANVVVANKAASNYQGKGPDEVIDMKEMKSGSDTSE